jgi:Na+(H+)/acetate symporter ActP
VSHLPADDLAVSTGIGWGSAFVVIVAAVYPALLGVYWAIPIAAGAVAAAIGIWRGVRILAMMLNHMYWRDLEVPAAEEGPDCTTCGDDPQPGRYCPDCGR